MVITDNPLAPEVVAAPDALESPDTTAPAGKQAFHWHPDRSVSGPLSILISGRDKKIVVLRGGVEIGSSAITIDGPVAQTMAFSLRGVDETGYHWLRRPLPGQSEQPPTVPPTSELTPTERARVHMPEAFRLAIVSALQPGTTLLVIRDSLASGGTGKRMTVITSDGK